MERQQQMMASEQYKQHLIKQIAVNTGIAASDLRSDTDLQNRQDRVLNPTRETGTQHNPETPEGS
eukprot:10711101-Heterocapsa_arctica.AAC.1